MDRSFRQGLLVGVLAPLMFLGAVVLWVHRYTGMVPIPTRRTDEGEVVVRLVNPREASEHLRNWWRGLEPVVSSVRAAYARLRTHIIEPEESERPGFFGRSG